MTLTEISDTFDTLVGSYVRQQGFGIQEALAFDEYEKSVFLTKAQEQLIISLYSGKNSNGDSFESSEELRRYLDNLIVNKTENAFLTDSLILTTDTSYICKKPEDMLFIIYEQVNWNIDKCLVSSNIQVVPTTHDEYQRIKDNPFRGPNDHRVLRLDKGDSKIELISKYPISSYTFRYLKKPYPIILVDLAEDNLTINGKTVPKELEIDSSLHQRLVELAVQIALQFRGINNNQRG